MSKEVYLNELIQYLKPLPPAEQADIIAEFREHFELAEFNGRSKEEVIAKLGNPRLVAREALAQYQIRKAGKSLSLSGVIKAVIATMSLGLFNLIIVLLPFAASLALLAGVFGFALFLIVSPILLSIQHQSIMILTNEFFLMAGLVGAGLLLFIGAVKFTRLYYDLVLRYLRYCLKVIKRK
ncbi:HAAS signaling domain-containing protein [Paenibacillus pinihumi]|uniref:HAAS signaling domain-containing protein n=1 Tax=Paenibacillus pinihumi TaxID=669462 RepID=UPI00041A5F35|nr:DUF1700 domain-containing protein [Paenibacillus pinihumi]